MAQAVSPQGLLATEERSGDSLRGSGLAVKGKGQPGARPVPLVTGGLHRSTQGVLKKNTFSSWTRPLGDEYGLGDSNPTLIVTGVFQPVTSAPGLLGFLRRPWICRTADQGYSPLSRVALATLSMPTMLAAVLMGTFLSTARSRTDLKLCSMMVCSLSKTSASSQKRC